jgi:CSLREA domain-containing protein
MNITIGKLTTTAALILCAALPAQLLANQFTVDTTIDPDIVDPSNCTAGLQPCSLREALAAADQTAEHDVVVFSVGDPVYITRKLTVYQPVTIDGGGMTTVRVHQGYTIKTLPDRPVFSKGDVAVLQPTYFSVSGPSRPMLELFGAGSVVQNMIIDGSITPLPADLGLARIDFESNDTTDFVLYTNDDDKWLVAGGIFMTGSPTVSGNELRNFNDTAVRIESSLYPMITDNDISGGAGGQRRFSADGLSIRDAAFSVVNTASGLNVNGNNLAENVTGIELESMDTSLGANVIEDNIVADNLKAGISIMWVLGAQVLNNEVDANQEFGIHIKTAGEISVSDNEVKHNGTDPTFHGGILVNEGSGNISLSSNEVSDNSGFGVVIDASHANTLSNNEVKNNGDVGIILLSGAQLNQIEFNEVTGNAVGVLAGHEFEQLFPSLNTFQGNELRSNTLIDALDYDPVCNDLWSGNTIDTAASASINCIDQQ